MDEILRALIEFLKEASPLVWGALIRQIYSSAIAQIFWAVIALVCGGMSWRNAARFSKAWGDREAVYWLKGLAILLLLASLGLVISGVMMIYNPSYYAIRHILDVLGR